MKHYVDKEPIIAAFPSVLQIEVTSKCNLACVMCPSTDLTRPRQNMDLALFEKIIAEAKGKSELAILHLMGEPLINPELDKMIKICKQANIRSVISTNGMLLDEQRQKSLCRSGLDTVILSFDGARKETYEKVRRGAKYERVKSNIEQFLKIKDRPHAVVQMISLDLTCREQEEFKKLWEKYSADVLSKPYTKWQGNLEKINRLGGGDHPALENKVCDRLWKWATIMQDGTVVPCCRDYDATIQFGNLRHNSIKEIWNNRKFADFRSKHAAGRNNLPICKNCDYDPIIFNDVIGLIGTTLFDSYSILRLMYNLNYLNDG